ncbi:MAG: TlpA disulfide reductase family protein [Pseudomonadota bacterium]
MQASSSNQSMRILIKLLGTALVLAVVVLAYFSLSKKTVAPDVTYITLKGEKITSLDLRGKVVLVNFWATSCSACVQEMPQMAETYNKYNGKGLELVAVAMSYDAPNYVLNFADSRQLPFKVALDTSGSLATAFGDVKLTPTTFVIDKQGKILKRYVGQPEFAELHRLLETALAA